MGENKIDQHPNNGLLRLIYRMTFLWNISAYVVFLVMFSAAEEDTVNTTSGLVFGAKVPGTNVTKFLGIPYAEPPIGERRFRPPVMKTRMTDIFNATIDGFSCPQTPTPGLENLFGNISMSEDCLNLNIYVPANASKTEPLTVMVWVYGGGYTIGAAIYYNPTILAELNDVIVVVINYRIGILGFLSTMDENAVGNFGLRDQCLALQWVKENIEEFGGNSGSVTIFGESAGAGSVTQLAMAASCEGLFHRVIAQSGSPLAIWANNPDPIQSAKALGNQLGCPSDKTSSLVQCLREKSTQELLKYQSDDGETVDPSKNPPWVPTYTSDFFSFVPKELPIWKGIPIENKMNRYDLLAGLCMEEGEGFYDLWMAPLRANGEVQDKTDGLPIKFLNQTLVAAAEATLQGDSDRADKLLPSLWLQYTDWHNRHSNFTNSKMLIELLGDSLFHVNSVQYARLHAEFAPLQREDNSDTGQTYFYRLKPRLSFLDFNPWTVGATHGDEIYFLFGYLHSGLFNATVQEIHLSDVMMEYWTNFAKTGNPNEPSKRYISTVWPTYSLHAEEYIDLDVSMTGASIDEHPYATRVAFWDEFIPEQVKWIEKEVEQKPCDTDTTSPARNVFTHSFCYIGLITSLCVLLSNVKYDLNICRNT